MLKLKTDINVEKTMIDLLIERGCNVNTRNTLNMTPLLTATQSGCINTVKALIDHGANIETAGGENLSCSLHIAVEYNYTTIIEHLLKCGVNVYSKRRDGQTALHVASKNGKLGIVTLLLEKLMDPDARDNNGKTALHWACWYENLEIMRELLIWGADVNAKDKSNVTPIILSQRSGSAAWNELQRYVMKLKAAGIDIAKHNNDNIYVRQIDTVLLVSSAEMELANMKAKRINNNATLADVMKMNVNKLAAFKNNRAFKELISSENFDNDFPCYSSIIKSLCARGIIRSNLVNKGTKVLRGFRDPMLPEYCTHEIFKYLSNDDLINLIQVNPSNSRLNTTENQYWNEKRLYHEQEMYALMSI